MDPSITRFSRDAFISLKADIFLDLVGVERGLRGAGVFVGVREEGTVGGDLAKGVEASIDGDGMDPEGVGTIWLG
jgi:hypothetical protein